MAADARIEEFVIAVYEACLSANVAGERLTEGEVKGWASLDWTDVQRDAWSEPKTKTEQAFRDWLGGPSVIEVMPFGKHRGRRIADIPSDYLMWLVAEFRPDGDVTALVQNALYTARLELRLRWAVKKAGARVSVREVLGTGAA
jgi:uncharacterized protein (DUF3820 family)